MAEFNLIPNEYRMHRARARMTVRLSLAVGGLLVALGIGLAGFDFMVSAKEARLAELRERQALSVREQQHYQELLARKRLLEGEVLLLESLKSGPPVGELIATLEKAVLGTDVWFVSWQFRRAGIVVEDETEARLPSYFLMAQSADAFPRQWDSLTHMTIHGEAMDHAALSRFVQRLFDESAVEDVRVQRSTREANGVVFNLAVVVRTQGETL